MNKNYYEILGVSKEADAETIKHAAQARASEINEAFRQLYSQQMQSEASTQATNRTQAPEISESFAHEPLQTKQDSGQAQQRRSSVQFGQHKQSKKASRGSGSMGNFWGAVLSKCSIDAPTSAKEVAIFVGALAFVAYMASGFFIPPEKRFATERVELKRLGDHGD